MKNKSCIQPFFLIWLFASATVFAQTPNQLIDESLEQLSPMVQEGYTYYQEDPERLYGNIARLFGTFVDFNAFARGVMGAHFAASNEAQREKFSGILRQSLARTFTDGLMSLGEYSLEIQEARQTKPKKAQVTMKVTTSESAIHELSYSLGQNQDGLWRVRNIVFDGVNLGLTFRNQFADEVANSAGDIESAIGNWKIAPETE